VSWHCFTASASRHLDSFHRWLDLSTWHWAWVEIGGVVAVILFICLLAAVFSRGGGGGAHSPSRADVMRRESQLSSQAMSRVDQVYDHLDRQARRRAGQ
jgi:hypothetical protein